MQPNRFAPATARVNSPSYSLLTCPNTAQTNYP
jgi:hypothetical protein